MTTRIDKKLWARLTEKDVQDALPLWTQEVLARIVVLNTRLAYVQKDHQADVADLIDEAARLVAFPLSRWHPHKRLSQWWTGSRIERAWASLREAELLCVEFADARGREVALDAAFRYARYLPGDDPSRARFDALVIRIGQSRTEKSVSAPRWDASTLMGDDGF